MSQFLEVSTTYLNRVSQLPNVGLSLTQLLKEVQIDEGDLPITIICP